MVNRVVVGAHYGLRDWLVQRITAIVMAAYTVLVILPLILTGPFQYRAWKAVFSQGWVRLATLLFVASMLLHAWIGLRDILMDYVKPAGVRLTLQVLVILALAGFGAWAVEILWRS